MVIKVAVLRSVSRYPVASTVKDQQVEYPVVDRRASPGFAPEIEIPDVSLELGNQRGFGTVVYIPSLDFPVILSGCGFNCSRIAVGEDAGPIPETYLPAEHRASVRRGADRLRPAGQRRLAE